MDLKEPYITINSVPLTLAQAMTVRVAIGNFLMELQDESTVEELGPIGPLYRERLIEISKIMSTGVNK